MTKNMLTFRKTICSSGQDSDSREHARGDADPGKAHEAGRRGRGEFRPALSSGLSVPRMTFADSVTGSNPLEAVPSYPAHFGPKPDINPTPNRAYWRSEQVCKL